MDDNKTMKNPYLVQRLCRKDPKFVDLSKIGIDRVCSLDYMGSAEFEFGAIPTALRTMRNYCSVLRCMEFNVGEHKGLSFVGNLDHFAYATKWFSEELKDMFCHKAKESTYIHYILNDKDPELGKRICGWWALDQKVPWAIFLDMNIGKQWFDAIIAGSMLPQLKK